MVAPKPCCGSDEIAMDAAATERDWFNLQDAAGLVLAKGMFLRLTIACCLASISAAQGHLRDRDMRVWIFFSSTLIQSLPLLHPLPSRALPSTRRRPSRRVPQSATRAIAAAANGFVATLGESQQGKLIYDFGDEAQRKRWHYFPPGMFPRGGLRVGDLAERQRAAAMRVLAAALSPQGPIRGMEPLGSRRHGSERNAE